MVSTTHLWGLGDGLWHCYTNITVDFVVVRMVHPPPEPWRQRDGQVLKEKRSADGIEQEAKKGMISKI